MIDRTTARCGSAYEWGVHVALFGRRIGLTEAQRASLVHGGPGDACWSDDDRLLLRLGDELHDTCTLSDPPWAELRAAHAEPALLELRLLAGFCHTVSWLTNALELPLEGFAARFPPKDARTADAAA